MMTIQQAFEFVNRLGVQVTLNEQVEQRIKDDLLQSRHPVIYKSGDITISLHPNFALEDLEDKEDNLVCCVHVSFTWPVVSETIQKHDGERLFILFSSIKQFELYATDEMEETIRALIGHFRSVENLFSITNILRLFINFGRSGEGYCNVGMAYVLQLYSHQSGLKYIVLVGRQHNHIVDVHCAHVCASLHDVMLYLDDYLNRTFSV